MTPVAAVLKGAAAGAAGTLAMDLVWYRRYRRGGGDSSFIPWEFSAGLDSWDSAPAPAQLGRRLAEAFLQRPLEPRWAGLTNNLTHWGYGAGWGSAFGVVAASLRAGVLRRATLGPLFGAAVWASSYATLPLARLYKPIWEYDAATLARDLSAHLAYGAGTAVTFAVLAALD